MKRAPRNRTLTVTEAEAAELRQDIVDGTNVSRLHDFCDVVILGNTLCILDMIPDSSIDLIIADPPYNLTKQYGKSRFKTMSDDDYLKFLRSWLPRLCKKLKPTGSIYLCCDWKCSSMMQQALSENVAVINRITWQREKGRSAGSNWKNAMEDIWFGVADRNHYTFNVDAVKMRRRVIAPYREAGMPRGWSEDNDGRYRFTGPSNFWDDISVPFWSMPENTDHPAQKSEKLMAKLILASSNPGDIVLDPFGGSGTAAVTARKLNRHFCTIEREENYCLLAAKRLRLAKEDKSIQGYNGETFLERNTPLPKRNIHR